MNLALQDKVTGRSVLEKQRVTLLEATYTNQRTTILITQVSNKVLILTDDENVSFE